MAFLGDSCQRLAAPWVCFDWVPAVSPVTLGNLEVWLKLHNQASEAQPSRFPQAVRLEATADPALGSGALRLSRLKPKAPT